MRSVRSLGNSSGHIIKLIRRCWEAFEHTLHRLSNHAIEIDGDTATARTYVDVLLIARDAKPHKTSDVNATGFYDDELVRTGEGWRINRRKLTMVRNRSL